MYRRNLFALDLGTTKFCIAALTWENEKPSLRIIDIPAEGMHRGMVADFSKTERCLRELIEKAERELGVIIEKVIVGVAGSHLRSRICQHVIQMGRSNCQERHIKRLIEEVEAREEEPFREILHCVPISYRIDKREEIENPLGFSGNELHGNFFVLDADKDYLKDMIRICNANGLEVQRLYAEPFASASVFLDDEAKRIGVAIADIGGGTTDGVVFQNGKPVKAFTINVAGSMMTKDIAVGLNLAFKEAEFKKLQFGLQYYNEDPSLRHELDPISKKIFIVLGSRIQELGFHIASQLRDFKGLLGSGIILTGGGSQVIGIDAFLTDRFKIKVAVEAPEMPIKGLDTQGINSRYATAIGLLNLEIGRSKSLEKLSGTWSRRYIDQFINWIRELS